MLIDLYPIDPFQLLHSQILHIDSPFFRPFSLIHPHTPQRKALMPLHLSPDISEKIFCYTGELIKLDGHDIRLFCIHRTVRPIVHSYLQIAFLINPDHIFAQHFNAHAKRIHRLICRDKSV